MKFELSKVYTAANADEINVGDKVVIAQNLRLIKYQMSQRDYYVWTITEIREDTYSDRFVTAKGAFPLVYLIERAKNCYNCEGCTACIKPDRTFGCTDWKPKTNRNLCDSCKQCFAECPATPDDIIFGDGVGNDNVYTCDKYEKKAEKHYRPFRDVDELIKVWKQKWSEKTNGQKWHDCKLNMPFIYVKSKLNEDNKGCLITTFFDKYVMMNNHQCFLSRLFDEYTFLDGSPCGIEVEE